MVPQKGHGVRHLSLPPNLDSIFLLTNTYKNIDSKNFICTEFDFVQNFWYNIYRKVEKIFISGYSAVGSARDLGSRSRWFKSSYSDQQLHVAIEIIDVVYVGKLEKPLIK